MMDYDSPRDTQTGLGTGLVIVMEKSTDMVAGIARFAYFRPRLSPFAPLPDVVCARSTISKSRAGSAPPG